MPSKSHHQSNVTQSYPFIKTWCVGIRGANALRNRMANWPYWCNCTSTPDYGSTCNWAKTCITVYGTICRIQRWLLILFTLYSVSFSWFEITVGGITSISLSISVVLNFKKGLDKEQMKSLEVKAKRFNQNKVGTSSIKKMTPKSNLSWNLKAIQHQFSCLKFLVHCSWHWS